MPVIVRGICDGSASLVAATGSGPTLIDSGVAASKVTAAVVASNEITVEAWIAPDNTVQNGPARIVTISDTTTTRNTALGQGVFNNGGDRIEARLRTTGTGPNGTPATQTAVGTLDTSLQHVVYTRNAAGTTTVYIDGVTVTTSTASGDMTGWDTGMQLALAAELDGTRNWEGEYSLVAIYDQALTAAEVTQNFAAGPNPTTGGSGGGSGPALSYTSYYSFAGTTIGYANQTGFTAIAAGHLGTTEATINPAGAAVRQTYTPFGATRSTATNVLGTDRTYTGQTDDDTGLLHYRARQYDPVLARFVQADSIIPGAGDLQNFNRYGYVLNNPVRYTDPTGRWVHGKIVDAVGSAGTVVIDTAGDAVDAAGDVLVDAGEAGIGLATDVGGLVVDGTVFLGTDVVAPGASAVGSRAATYGNYKWRSSVNFWEDPLQGTIDQFTGTAFLSELNAMFATVTGARISDKNCVDDAVCFVGGTSLAELTSDKSVIALGTTIHAGNGPLRVDSGRHEGGHVQDYQLFGGFGFLGYYLGETANGIGYNDLGLEQRAVSVETTGQRGRDASGVIADVAGWLWPF